MRVEDERVEDEGGVCGDSAGDCIPGNCFSVRNSARVMFSTAGDNG